MVGGSLEAMLRALNSLARTGWMLRGVPAAQAETVAQHSYLAAIIALELAAEDGRTDPLKAAAIALLHDIGEAWIGDIPGTARLGERKTRIEEKYVSEAPLSNTAKKLYREYVEKTTREAIVAKTAEQLATHLAAKWYKQLGYPVDDILANTLREAVEAAAKAGIIEALARLAKRLGIEARLEEEKPEHKRNP